MAGRSQLRLRGDPGPDLVLETTNDPVADTAWPDLRTPSTIIAIIPTIGRIMIWRYTWPEILRREMVSCHCKLGRWRGIESKI